LYAAFGLVVILPIIGIIVLAIDPEPWKPRKALAVHTLGWTTIALAVALAIVLLFARPAMCRVLGGEVSGSSCQHEWGGGGH
jgi:hypothetical protein